MNFVSRYKFVIAIENAMCEDYITEKLWRPLMVGSVPIYLGSPSVAVSSITIYYILINEIASGLAAK